MRIALNLVSVLFGALSLVAAAAALKQSRKGLPHVVMAAGSLLVLAAVVLNIVRLSADWTLALAGCVLICFAAIYNGIKSGSFHLLHHCIRIALSAALVAGFILY